jgi:uncharacterized membrane protein YeaQ/YmgE (transglycosylase-associated protein family)
VGIVGSFIGGFVGAPLSIKLLGKGPEYMVSLLVAAVVAAVLLLVVGLIKR